MTKNVNEIQTGNNGGNNEQTQTPPIEQNATQAPIEQIAMVDVNGISFPKANVNHVTFDLSGIGYAAADASDPDAPATFFLRTNGKRVWSITQAQNITNSDGTVENRPAAFTDASSDVLISEYSFMRAFAQNCLLSKDVHYSAYRAASQEDAEDTRSIAERRKEVLDDAAEAWKSKYNGVSVKVIQIHVPAGQVFVSPFSNAAVAKAYRYETPKVFSYVEGVQFNLGNADHRKVLKDIKTTFYNEDDGFLWIDDLQEAGVIRRFGKDTPERKQEAYYKMFDPVEEK